MRPGKFNPLLLRIIVLLLPISITTMLSLSANATHFSTGQSPAVPQTGVTPTVVTYPTCPPGTLGAPPNPTEVAKSLHTAYLNSLLWERKGTIIAQGSNTTPSGLYNLRTYRVEEVALPGPTTFEALMPDATKDRLQMQTITTDTIWRVSVTGGPFWSGAQVWTMWLDDALLGKASEGLDEVTTVVFDRTLLREGATLGVGYGYSRDGGIPEKLRFNRAR